LIGAVVAVLVSHAQPLSTKLSRTDAFGVAYGMSLRVDECGDVYLGQVLRKPVSDKFDLCPFSNEARLKFHAWASGMRIGEQAALDGFIAAHGKYPIRPDGMKPTCHDVQTSNQYLKARELLDDYILGKSSVDTVITDPRDVSGGGP
jgi:hypothetical protein